MKKKEKAKPRKRLMGNSLKERTFNYYLKEMEENTSKYNKFLKTQQIDDDINFSLFQSITNKEKMRDILFSLAYFYDQNFVGNKDFIHIPNISTITNNVVHYPIMLATKKDAFNNESIIGATTIKFENNASISENPYFPSKNETVLSITGILSKFDATFDNGEKIKGIGKQLFKMAINGAYEINKNENIRLICEIDCRNKNSLRSICNAVSDLNNENVPVQLFVAGYYEILNKKNKLIEAPTLILELDLTGNKDIWHSTKYFDFSACGNAYNELNEELLEVIRNNTKEYRRFINLKEDKVIVYHKIKPFDAQNTILNVGNAASGNERLPILQSINIEYAN